MTDEQLAGSIASRYKQPERYDDLYQEAWVAILEANDKGLDNKAKYWHVRTHVNNYFNYADRTVPLPQRSGSKKLLDVAEITQFDDMSMSTEGPEVDYERQDTNDYVRKCVAKLPQSARRVIIKVDYEGKTYKQLAQETGLSYQLWQQRHTEAIKLLSELVKQGI